MTTWKLMMIVVLALTAYAPTLGAEETDEEEEVIKDEANSSVFVCNELREKLDIFLPLQDTISREFASLSDPNLCYSASKQCEELYEETRDVERQYRKSCDADYAVGDALSECDYSANQCPKYVDKYVKPTRPLSRFHAGT